MKLHAILFPTDFSELNRAALQYASTLAAEAGAVLHIVHVHDPRDLSETTDDAASVYSTVWQQKLEVSRNLLDSVVPTTPGVVYEQHCPVGRSENEIVALATEIGADLIVMASHGRTGLSRLLMGSVAESVMRMAPCPVLIVRQPATAHREVANNAAIAAQEGVPS